MFTLTTWIYKTTFSHLAAATLLGALMLAGAANASAQRFTPERELLNRLIQTTGNDPASRAFVQGRDQINDGNWISAAAIFARYVNEYPSSKNVDAALYWLAYAYEKQKKFADADMVLVKLLKKHSSSAWRDDAEKLRLIVRSKVDPDSLYAQKEVKPDADCELKVIALQSLCQADKARCASYVADILKSSSASTCLVVKEQAIRMLGRSGGADAVPALIQMARTEPNERLRMRAIEALGQTGDERGLEVLRELAMSPLYEDESPTDRALHALAGHENPRAPVILADVIINSRNLRARTHGVSLLSGRRGDDVVDQLFRIYDAVTEVEIKKYVLAGLGNRKDPRAIEFLIKVARSANDPELRKQAIHAIPNRNDQQDLDVLLSLYDSERNEELKSYMLDAIGRYQNPRAHDKLMQVVKSNEPLERRKRAINMLSRSKDPRVLQFLADLLK
jgi:HEAT repeat protein